MFLDRDGVLNEAVVRNGVPHSPLTLEALRIYPEAPADLARLKRAGFDLIMTTNQPNVARGIQSRETVDAMNAHIASELNLDDVRVCYHDDADGCICRKPLPGLLTSPPPHDLRNSFLVGDRWRDVEAGHRAGCRTVFIDRGYSERRPQADHSVGSLREAVDWILKISERE